jgi:hypothetical protein
MCKNVADSKEPEREKERREQAKQALPGRCRFCQDYPICDLDFCLKWWH